MFCKKSYVFGLAAILLVLLTSVSFAEQIGDDYFGTSDLYGVYITDADGSISYLWFWTESAREMIMGDLTEPGTNVMGIPEGGIPIGKYPLNPPEKKDLAPSKFFNTPSPDSKFMVAISCSGKAPEKSLKDSIIDQASNYNQIRFVNDVELCAADNYIGACGDYILNVKCYEIVPPTDNEGTFFPFGGIANSHSKVHDDMDICSMWYYCDRWYGRYGENFSGITDCEDLSEELDIALGSCAVPESFAGGYKQLR